MREILTDGGIAVVGCVADVGKSEEDEESVARRRNAIYGFCLRVICPMFELPYVSRLLPFQERMATEDFGLPIGSVWFSLALDEDIADKYYALPAHTVPPRLYF